jgi:hypothetical protein
MKLVELTAEIGGGVVRRYIVKRNLETKRFGIFHVGYGRFEPKYGEFETERAAERYLRETDVLVLNARQFGEIISKEINEGAFPIMAEMETLKLPTKPEGVE